MFAAGTGPMAVTLTLAAGQVHQRMHGERRRLVFAGRGEEPQRGIQLLGPRPGVPVDALQVVPRVDEEPAPLIGLAHRRHRPGLRLGVFLPLRPLGRRHVVGPFFQRRDDLLLDARCVGRLVYEYRVDGPLAPRRELDGQRLVAGGRAEPQRAELVAALELHALLLPADLHGEVEVLVPQRLAGAAHHVDLVLARRNLDQEGVLPAAEDRVFGDRVGPDRRRLLGAAAAVLDQRRIRAGLGLQAVLRLPAEAGLLRVNVLGRDARKTLPHGRLLRAHVEQPRPAGILGGNDQQGKQEGVHVIFPNSKERTASGTTNSIHHGDTENTESNAIRFSGVASWQVDWSSREH